jgi:hypothetical protein
VNYLAASRYYPCPRDHAACGPAPSRPPRALWMYDMVDEPGKVNLKLTGLTHNFPVDPAV